MALGKVSATHPLLCVPCCGGTCVGAGAEPDPVLVLGQQIAPLLSFHVCDLTVGFRHHTGVSHLQAAAGAAILHNMQLQVRFDRFGGWHRSSCEPARSVPSSRWQGVLLPPREGVGRKRRAGCALLWSSPRAVELPGPCPVVDGGRLRVLCFARRLAAVHPLSDGGRLRVLRLTAGGCASCG